jgi:cytochrome c
MTIRTITRPLALAAALAVSSAAFAQSDPGEAQFNQRCKVCHVVTPGGAAGPIAPNLRGVVGRKAASTAFKTYSPALKASNLVWSSANLDKFLAAPAKVVPGTRMVIAVSDAAQRKAIIAWLAKQK